MPEHNLENPIGLKREALNREWKETLECFESFHSEHPSRRFHQLGVLFEKLSPWIKRGIRITVLRHFLILPTEMLLARLFAKAARRDTLHGSFQGFFMWIEGTVLTDLADPCDSLGVVNGAQGEPPAEVQAQFNELPFSERAIFYLYMIEGFSVHEVATRTGIPNEEAASALDQIWTRLDADNPDNRIPSSWRRPPKS